MNYNETLAALWTLIGDDVRISVIHDDADIPSGEQHLASFEALLPEPAEWVGTGWRVGGTTTEGEEPKAGAGHVVASFSPEAFLDGESLFGGMGVRMRFEGGISVAVVKSGAPKPGESRVLDVG
jgi:hypothetical protein